MDLWVSLLTLSRINLVHNNKNSLPFGSGGIELGLNMVVLGTELKFNLSLEPIDGLHMGDYDFECVLFVYTNRKVIIPKSRMIKVDDDNYIVKLEDEDAIKIGRGSIVAEITAYIPDADFSDGLRTEKLRLCTDVMIV